MTSRRDFLSHAPALALAAASDALVVDPKPLHEISPWLYMQFMEPLGVTDSSVEAAWDYEADDWRADFVEAAKDLAPGTIRWGGLYSRYYKWREGVGPAARRPWMRNYIWGGKETNRVGTHELADLCKRCGTEPLMCVNFLGDGDERWRKTKEGDRTGDAREAADWVSYANDPSNRERTAHGRREPYGIRLWQIGNETSYGKTCFTKAQAIERTSEFAREMKKRDASIKLIGWGDRGAEGLWAADMAERTGDLLDMVAIHMMGQSPRRKDTVLAGNLYQFKPEQAWEELNELAENVEKRVVETVQALELKRLPHGIAVTEGHLSARPHNANAILLEWLSGAYHARSMLAYERHAARVKMATCADFEGNRWTVNAVLLQTPGKTSYLTPAGSVMRLFGRHRGAQGVAIRRLPSGLDVSASRTGNRIWLHVANTQYSRSVETALVVEGMSVRGGRVFEIAPENLREQVNVERVDIFRPREKQLAGGADCRWRFPAGSVTAVELELG